MHTWKTACKIWFARWTWFRLQICVSTQWAGQLVKSENCAPFPFPFPLSKWPIVLFNSSHLCSSTHFYRRGICWRSPSTPPGNTTHIYSLFNFVFVMSIRWFFAAALCPLYAFSICIPSNSHLCSAFSARVNVHQQDWGGFWIAVCSICIQLYAHNGLQWYSQ